MHFLSIGDLATFKSRAASGESFTSEEVSTLLTEIERLQNLYKEAREMGEFERLVRVVERRSDTRVSHTLDNLQNFTESLAKPIDSLK